MFIKNGVEGRYIGQMTYEFTKTDNSDGMVVKLEITEGKSHVIDGSLYADYGLSIEGSIRITEARANIYVSGKNGKDGTYTGQLVRQSYEAGTDEDIIEMFKFVNLFVEF